MKTINGIIIGILIISSTCISATVCQSSKSFSVRRGQDKDNSIEALCMRVFRGGEGMKKALIIYDTKFGNTEKVAKMLTEEMKAHGFKGVP